MYKIPYYTASTRTLRELIKAVHTAPPEYVDQYERAIPRVVVLIVRATREKLLKRRQPRAQIASAKQDAVLATWRHTFKCDVDALYEDQPGPDR